MEGEFPTNAMLALVPRLSWTFVRRIHVLSGVCKLASTPFVIELPQPGDLTLNQFNIGYILDHQLPLGTR